jgi:hypothetical protein
MKKIAFMTLMAAVLLTACSQNNQPQQVQYGDGQQPINNGHPFLDAAAGAAVGFGAARMMDHHRNYYPQGYQNHVHYMVVRQPVQHVHIHIHHH